jgi:hypothetical protein
MASITFFQQARADGGVRTGIDVDGSTVLESFEEGAEEYDPTLLWYVDLRCKSDSLPKTGAGAQKWLREHSDVIRRGFRSAAEKVQVGFDHSIRPFEYSIPKPPPDAEMRVVVSAVRRMEARSMAGELRRIARQWESLIRDVAPLEKV